MGETDGVLVGAGVVGEAVGSDIVGEDVDGEMLGMLVGRDVSS